MQPIDFKESDRLLGKPPGMTDEECSSLPVFTDGRQCISCWRPTWREKIKLLFTGRIWISVLSGLTQPPIWVGINRPFVKSTNEEEK